MVVTLPLLPEIPYEEEDINGKAGTKILMEGKSDNLVSKYSYASRLVTEPCFLTDRRHQWLNFEYNNNNVTTWNGCLNESVNISDMGRSIRACMTVECVTETWVDGNGLGGCTDEERKRKLEGDTCPGFISDGMGRVRWTNWAFRRMIELEGEGNEMGVELVMKEEVGMIYGGAFTCRVRMAQCAGRGGGRCGKEIKSSVTLPCDGWRMEGGGFAWRLDVEAALRLGR